MPKFCPIKSFLTHTPNYYKKGAIVEVFGEKVEIIKLEFESLDKVLDGTHVAVFRVFYAPMEVGG